MGSRSERRVAGWGKWVGLTLGLSALLVAGREPAVVQVVPDLASFETQVFDLTNQQRQANGIPLLVRDSRLDTAAPSFSSCMGTAGFLKPFPVD